MLSFFPDLLIYQLAAPTAIRLAVGILALMAVIKILPRWQAGQPQWSKTADWLIGWSLIGYAGGAILVIIGLFTQAAGLIIAVMSLVLLGSGYWQGNHFGLSSEFFWLMALVSATLLLSGAGWWAFDLPV